VTDDDMTLLAPVLAHDADDAGLALAASFD
jgi:hypothetical protein